MESPRGIQVSYPVPEPIVTPRAREGLRTVVPTLFPPSAINRGESVHVFTPEPERRPRPPPPPLGAQESLRFPKKRGRKPKCLHHEKHDESAPEEPDAKRRLLEEMPTVPRRLHHREETSEHTLIQLTKRFQEKTTITPKGSSQHRHVGGARLSYTCAFSPDVRKRDHDCLSRMQQSALRRAAEERRLRAMDSCALQRQVGVTSRPDHDSAPRSASCWTPSFTNLDSVTVTDVTINLLTVTVRESSTDKGFFKEERWGCQQSFVECPTNKQAHSHAIFFLGKSQSCTTIFNTILKIIIIKREKSTRHAFSVLMFSFIISISHLFVYFFQLKTSTFIQISCFFSTQDILQKEGNWSLKNTWTLQTFFWKAINLLKRTYISFSK